MTDGGTGFIGRPTVRIDGVAKVTGAARFASDEPTPNAAFAWLVTSSIARGRIDRLDLKAAQAVPGVLDILTHENVGHLVAPLVGPDGGATTTSLESDQIWHGGQIIAVVVAETFESAREAAHRVVVTYDAQPAGGTFDSPGVTEEIKQEDRRHKDLKVGDAAAAYAAAPVKIDARYETPPQHHNPLELFTTTCVWDGPNLTVYEPSTGIWGTKTALARRLRIEPENVRVVSRFVGGAFGSKGGLTARTAWIALAAKRLRRAVKLVPTRTQGFTLSTHRAETRHHLRLGATRAGKLTAMIHDGWEVSSRPSGYTVSGAEATARMYACETFSSRVTVVHADRSTPGFMRAPSEVPYMFALESGIDELAYALGMDPIELRRVNDARRDPVDGRPYSSRSLMACYDQAAAKFGWSRRNPEPRSMRDGDWLIGWGCGTATYPSNIAPAAARLSLTPQGKARIGLAAQDIGTGAYTLMAIMVADRLGLEIADVTVVMGDSDLPPVTVSGGSNNAATTTHVAAKACEAIRSRVAEAAVRSNDGVFAGADAASLTFAHGALVGPGGREEPLAKALGRVAGGALEVHVENTPEGLPPSATTGLYQGQVMFLNGIARPDVTAFAFGAHMIEVRVHSRTGEIRTPRLVSAYAAGTIVNPLTARSQFMGGAIWGVGSGLHEGTEIDPRAARYVNDNLGDYLIPVNADIEELEVILVPEADDRVNPMGVKGIGEVGIVGLNAAVANAVFHATGKRIRKLPIRIEDLL